MLVSNFHLMCHGISDLFAILYPFSFTDRCLITSRTTFCRLYLLSRSVLSSRSSITIFRHRLCLPMYGSHPLGVGFLVHDLMPSSHRRRLNRTTLQSITNPGGAEFSLSSLVLTHPLLLSNGLRHEDGVAMLFDPSLITFGTNTETLGPRISLFQSDLKSRIHLLISRNVANGRFTVSPRTHPTSHPRALK